MTHARLLFTCQCHHDLHRTTERIEEGVEERQWRRQAAKTGSWHCRSLWVQGRPV